MKLHHKEVMKDVRKDSPYTNIFQNRKVYKTTAVNLVPDATGQEIWKVHFWAPSLCLSHPRLSFSLTKWTNHEII